MCSHIVQNDTAACFGIAAARVSAAQLLRSSGIGTDSGGIVATAGPMLSALNGGAHGTGAGARATRWAHLADFLAAGFTHHRYGHTPASVRARLAGRVQDLAPPAELAAKLRDAAQALGGAADAVCIAGFERNSGGSAGHAVAFTGAVPGGFLEFVSSTTRPGGCPLWQCDDQGRLVSPPEKAGAWSLTSLQWMHIRFGGVEDHETPTAQAFRLWLAENVPEDGEAPPPPLHGYRLRCAGVDAKRRKETRQRLEAVKVEAETGVGRIHASRWAGMGSTLALAGAGAAEVAAVNAAGKGPDARAAFLAAYATLPVEPVPGRKAPAEKRPAEKGPADEPRAKKPNTHQEESPAD